MACTVAAFEQHYTVQEVAKLWAMSPDTVRRLFEDDPQVLKVSMPRLLKNARKRKPRVSLSIPASALERLHHQQTGGFRLEVKSRRRSV